MQPAAALILLAGCSAALELPASAQQAGAPEVRVVVRGSAPGRVFSEPAGIDCPGTCAAAFPAGTRIALRAESEAATISFRGACTSHECTVAGGQDVEVAVGFHRPGNVLFVSSIERAPGSFGGLAAVDAACAALARAAGLPGRFRAFLDAGDDELEAHAAGFMRPDGLPVAVSRAQLLLGNLLYPPALDESGTPVPDDAVAFTDLLANGEPRPLARRCEDYALAGGDTVSVGQPHGGRWQWLDAGEQRCDQPARWYCLSFDSQVDVAAPTVDAADLLLFVSDAFLPAGAGLAAADALCEAEGDGLRPGSYQALFARAGRPAVDGLLGERFVRPDGVRLGTRDDFARGRPRAPLAHRVGLPSDTPYAWLGAPSWTAAPGGGCAELTALDGEGETVEVAFAPVSTRRAPCSQPRRLICVQKP